MKALDISESRASRNLSALCDAGFLKLRREGLWAKYPIDRDNLTPQHVEMIDVVKKSLEGNKMALEDMKRLQSAEHVGPDGEFRCYRP